MDDEIVIPVDLPLDSDGFVRRECPSCEQEFKWFSHGEGDPDAEIVDQYFCPLCGSGADTDSWWTPAQLEYAQGLAGPQMDQLVEDAMANAFKGIKGLKYKKNSGFTFGIDTPEPLTEPDDMLIVEPPCHPNEPVKVPEAAAGTVYCLVCGSPFGT